jgi:methionine synthase II (cobalamin-independent)
MTNQQLKAHCEDVIANPQDHLDWVVDMARVALASLKAKSRISLTVCRRAEYEHELTVYDRMPDGSYDLYTAPPLPELKPIELPKVATWSDYVYESDAKRKAELMNEMRDEFIEAIRDAGYEVKS